MLVARMFEVMTQNLNIIDGCQTDLRDRGNLRYLRAKIFRKTTEQKQKKRKKGTLTILLCSNKFK